MKSPPRAPTNNNPIHFVGLGCLRVTNTLTRARWRAREHPSGDERRRARGKQTYTLVPSHSRPRLGPRDPRVPPRDSRPSVSNKLHCLLRANMDTKLFIREIKRRPGIWMPKHPEYNKRERLKQLWLEVKRRFPEYRGKLYLFINELDYL